MTTLKEKVRELNRSEDGVALRKFTEYLDSGRLKTRGGTPVIFDHNSMFEFFHNCDESIDLTRFDHLMYLADISHTFSF